MSRNLKLQHSIACTVALPVRDYDLDATLDCGQSFAWTRSQTGWEGVVGKRWVALESTAGEIIACTIEPQSDWSWLSDYLQTNVNLAKVFSAFPRGDARLKAAVKACRGLRLLRQDPWECLACFILSSTKQIVQIQQIVGLLRKRFGEPVAAPGNCAPTFTFPSPDRLAALTEAQLRECKMGFRAPYLLAAARRVASGELDLERIRCMSLAEARTGLIKLEGVGEKIADCVLLYGYGFPTAFPVDVWVARALNEFYFRGRKMPLTRLREFSASYFGPQAGYAQQYLFHHVRTRNR